MSTYLLIYLQSLPNVDFKIFGAFGVSLTLLLIFCGYLIKQISYYRDQLKNLRQAKNQEIKEIRQEKEDLQKERQAETQATIQALKETKHILKTQLESIKR